MTTHFERTRDPILDVKPVRMALFSPYVNGDVQHYLCGKVRMV